MNKEFKKINDNKFAFITTDEGFKKTIEVNKDRAKNEYEEINKGKKQILDNLAKVNSELKNAPEVDAELEKFIEMANKAADYNKAKQARANQAHLLTMLEEHEKTIKELENAIPELKRKQRS